MQQTAQEQHEWLGAQMHSLSGMLQAMISTARAMPRHHEAAAPGPADNNRWG